MRLYFFKLKSDGKLHSRIDLELIEEERENF